MRGVALVSLLFACRPERPVAAAPVRAAPALTVTATAMPVTPASASTAASPAPPCDADLAGWCPGTAGDPCGEHPDLASCRADPRCGGKAFHGESLVACSFDERGFGTNCPTVGCESLGRPGDERVIHDLAGAPEGDYTVYGFAADKFRCPACAKNGKCPCAGDYVVLSENKTGKASPLTDRELVVFTATPGALDPGRYYRVWLTLRATSATHRPTNDATMRSFERADPPKPLRPAAPP